MVAIPAELGRPGAHPTSLVALLAFLALAQAGNYIASNATGGSGAAAGPANMPSTSDPWEALLTTLEHTPNAVGALP